MSARSNGGSTRSAAGSRCVSLGAYDGSGYKPIQHDYGRQVAAAVAAQQRRGGAGSGGEQPGEVDGRQSPAERVVGRNSVPDTFESLWEAYTRQFIEKYRLDSEQSQKAWTICRECQSRGRGYVARVKDRLARAQKLLDELHGSQGSSACASISRCPTTRRSERDAQASARRISACWRCAF